MRRSRKFFPSFSGDLSEGNRGDLIGGYEQRADVPQTAAATGQVSNRIRFGRCRRNRVPAAGTRKHETWAHPRGKGVRTEWSADSACKARFVYGNEGSASRLMQAPTSIRRVWASDDALVALAGGRDRLFVLHVSQTEREVCDLPAARMLGHSVQDVCLITGRDDVY